MQLLSDKSKFYSNIAVSMKNKLMSASMYFPSREGVSMVEGQQGVLAHPTGRVLPANKSLRFIFLILFAFISNSLFSQADNPANDQVAVDLLKKASEKYKGYKNISANFKLLVMRPKLKPQEDDRKYTDTLTGQILLEGVKFKISIKEQEIVCDGKNIWTYVPADKEVQVNYFEETDDVFSPSKIFSLYKEGYLYMVKEKTVINGKNVTVIEMAPPNKKLTYFKIDVTIDNTSLQVIESKIYEKNGTRYVYKLTKQTPDVSTQNDTFTFDPKKHSGVKVVDLR